MTAATTNRQYRITIILDTRGREESAEQLVEEVSKEIATLGIEIKASENIGRKEFSRTPDPKLTAGNYIQYQAEGPAETSTLLQNHFRLNKLVNRIFVETA